MVTELRKAGVAADFAYGGKGLKGAMKNANRCGARYTIVAGERDLAEGVVQLKDMESGEQTRGRRERDRGGTGVEAGLRPEGVGGFFRPRRPYPFPSLGAAAPRPPLSA